MSDNPYQATEGLVDSLGPEAKPDPDLHRAADMLAQTKPWVRTISVIMWFISGCMVLGGLALAIGGTGAMGAMSGFVGLMYLFMAVIYVVPAVLLWKYANRIGLFLEETNSGRLADALESQKKFWKFVGIGALVVIGIYGGIIVLAAFVGIASRT